MDSVIGKSTNKKTALVLTERKTRYEIIELMKAHTADEVAKELRAKGYRVTLEHRDI